MKLTDNIKSLSDVFHENGYQIYLVGGAMRDYHLGVRDAFDYDFATNALPEAVMGMFKKVFPVGISHGTVLILHGGEEFEVTTFRTESTYSDNRHPDAVNFVTDIEDDLKRRDFTINAIAFDIANKKTIDLFDGKKDLKKKIIRAIGEPSERFREDALRMLRACRFSSQLEFTIEEKTLEAIKDNADLIRNVSSERIRDELVKIMKSHKPSIAIENMRETGLLKIIMPELLDGYGVHQNRFHKYDVYYHNLYSCDAAPAGNIPVRFAALLHDIAKPATSRGKTDDDGNTFYNHEVIGARISYKILKRLKFPNEEIDLITHLIRHHMFYYTSEWTDGAVRRFLRNVGVENLDNLFLLRDADRIGNGSKVGIPKAFIDFKDKIVKILEEDNALKVTDLKINGNILMTELGLKPGRIIGEILEFLLELVLDKPELNDSAVLLQLASEYYDKKKNYALEMYNDLPENLGKF